MNKYQWFPTECAPEKYPMTILRGDFVFNHEPIIYIPDSKTIYNGWGEIGSTHLVGEQLKLLPDQLAITWFSYTEDKFYGGRFNLPYEMILRLFNEGFSSPITRKMVTYDYIIVGLAPGGSIALWLAGNGIVTEICFLQAKEAVADWVYVNDNPSITRKQYVQAMLKEALNEEDLISLEKNGIPFRLWDNYRTQYPWEPFIVGKANALSIWLGTYNGEYKYTDFELENKPELRERGIVKDFRLRWAGTTGKKYNAIVDFNEQEIFAAFAKLSEKKLQQQLQLQIEISDIDQSVKMYLRNEKYILELKRCNINVYLN